MYYIKQRKEANEKHFRIPINQEKRGTKKHRSKKKVEN